MADIQRGTLIERVQEYIQWDPVKSTRCVIKNLYDEHDWDALEKCIMNRLAFGTAGFIYCPFIMNRFTRKNGCRI